MLTILVVFAFIAFKILSICWADKSSKNTRSPTTTSTTAHNEQNGTTKLTNQNTFPNNLLIISSYNGSLTKVSKREFSRETFPSVLEIFFNDEPQFRLIKLYYSSMTTFFLRKTEDKRSHQRQHGNRQPIVWKSTNRRWTTIEIRTLFPHITSMVIINNSIKALALFASVQNMSKLIPNFVHINYRLIDIIYRTGSIQL